MTATNSPTHHHTWLTLSQHAEAIAPHHMREWFEADPMRSTHYSMRLNDIELDYSRNRINTETITLLCELAETMHLPDKILALFSGEPVNRTEHRPALHTALRDPNHTPIFVKGENIAPLILEARHKMRTLTDQIHSHQWRGVTQKPITSVVTLGVGGSALGPLLCCDSLKDFSKQGLQCHFISSIDQAMTQDVLDQIDPASTLFIIASKTFGTLETMTNARALLREMQSQFGEKAIQQHFVAITANPSAARTLGIPDNNIFPMWDWVGGRYSIWSSIGLPLMLLIGSQAFDDFLMGAFEMDQHFRQAEFSKNMPVLLALLSIWYINFFNARAQAIIPYAHRLRHLPRYLQQLDMESNGKSTNLSHQPITYATGPIIFGEEGCHGQHAYHQLLHQGQHLIPADFILIGHAAGDPDLRQDMLVSSGLSQADALMLGKTYHEAHDTLLQLNYPTTVADHLAAHQVNPGNRPSNILSLKQLNPKNLGALLALYEHKVFAQSVIWDINPFDQWGVELGKQLLEVSIKGVRPDPFNEDAQ